MLPEQSWLGEDPDTQSTTAGEREGLIIVREQNSGKEGNISSGNKYE